MQTMRQLAKWSWRAWPILITIVIALVHWAILNFCYTVEDKTIANKIIALIIQIVGGLIVWLSIISNIKTLKGEKPLDLLISFFEDFPLLKRSRKLEPHSIYTETYFQGDIELREIINPKTAEEKFEYLQEQINKLRKDLTNAVEKLNIKSKNNESKMKSESLTESVSIRSLIRDISIGDVDRQFFGFLLLIYSAIAGYLA
jgi:hypothetical protein